MTLMEFDSAKFDRKAFATELTALRKEISSSLGEDDLRHLRKMERWTWLSTIAGYATAWIAPNPFSVFFMSLGTFARWTSIAHPISHRGYDKVPGVAPRHTSKLFGKGARRFIDWFDWILPEAWHEEHDLLHHYNLGESSDPDRVETNFGWLRESKLPMPLKYALVIFLGSTWKWLYYAPNTIQEQSVARARRTRGTAESSGTSLLNARFVDPRDPLARTLWLKSLVPYALWKFAVLPALFLPLGKWAFFSVLVNSIFAELLTNLHSFVMIAPNHAGDDLYQFDSPITDRDEFSIRQIIGSTNYACGNDVIDFLQGWLNYQIEHHLWPNVPLLAYQRMQPRVKALCEKYGVPYKQESVWVRARKTAAIMVGATSQKTFDRLPGAAGAANAPDAQLDLDASSLDADGVMA